MRDIGKYEPIGTIRTLFSEKFGVPRQSNLVKEAKGCIELTISEESLEGLDQFSHVWVLFDFDRVKETPQFLKVRPPRLTGEKVGIFASRSPHRPNPIGLSVLKIEKIIGRKLFVSGVDIVDGTPILDIKPYIKTYDAIDNSSEGWVAGIQDLPKYDVQIDAEVPGDLSPNLIKELLESDPRPIAYRSDKLEGFLHGIRIGSYNIKFFFSGNRIHVSQITS